MITAGSSLLHGIIRRRVDDTAHSPHLTIISNEGCSFGSCASDMSTALAISTRVVDMSTVSATSTWVLVREPFKTATRPCLNHSCLFIQQSGTERVARPALKSLMERSVLQCGASGPLLLGASPCLSFLYLPPSA
jgi:hypothetical protein